MAALLSVRRPRLVLPLTPRPSSRGGDRSLGSWSINYGVTNYINVHRHSTFMYMSCHYLSISLQKKCGSRIIRIQEYSKWLIFHHMFISWRLMIRDMGHRGEIRDMGHSWAGKISESCSHVLQALHIGVVICCDVVWKTPRWYVY